MEIHWVNCSAIYHGRGDTILPEHDRIVIIKDDNSVLIHNNEGIKPLNYMTGKSLKNKYSINYNPNGTQTWIFDSNKESLKITIHQHYGSLNPSFTHVKDPGLERDGTEEQLQTYLSENLHKLFPDLEFVMREYQTGAGPVDILSKNSEHDVIIEVKRVATSAAIHQTKRYLDECDNDTAALVIALDVRPSARITAEKKNIQWVQLDWTDRDNAIITETSY